MEPLVTILDLREHLVEALDEVADLVAIAGARCANRKILRGGHGARESASARIGAEITRWSLRDIGRVSTRLPRTIAAKIHTDCCDRASSSDRSEAR